MNIVALARDRYEDYFRRGLLEAARRDGCDVRYVGFRRVTGQIDLVHEGTLTRSLPITATPLSIAGFARESAGRENTILLNSAGFNWFWHVLYLRFAVPRASLVFDVYDWLYYNASFPKSYAMQCINSVYKWASDGVIVVSPELLPFYPGAFHLDNASNVWRVNRKKSQTPDVAIVASFDDRLDFDLLEQLLRLMPKVHFHFHGWVKDSAPDVKKRFESLCQCSNVRYHGPYENAELESLLSSYRIGLLPYSTSNRINQYVNPEKIYHYLRAGMEVIATPIPQARRMEPHLHLVDSASACADRINALLAGRGGKHPGQLGSRFHWSERWPPLRDYLESVAADK